MTQRLIGILLLGLGWACDSPVTPRSKPLPAAPVPQTRLNVSGIVTDDNGAPIAGAGVQLANVLGGTRRFTTSTNSAGRYEFDFPEELSPPTFISASSTNGSSIQPLDWAASNSVVKNLRVRPTPNVIAGQSIVVSFEQDSSLCVWEWSASDSKSCEYFTVTLEAPGLVTVEARAMDGGTTPVSIGWENPGSSDRFSERLDSAGRFWMNLSLPRGFTPRYEIRTWFAP
jgi:hypothetical protein